MTTPAPCREMVVALLGEVPQRDWQPFVNYNADGSRVLGWAYEAVSRTGRPVAVSFDEEASQLRLRMPATGLWSRGFEQTWDEVSDLETVREQLRNSLEQCLDQ